MMFSIAVLLTTFLAVDATFVCNDAKPKSGLVVRPYELPKVSFAALTKPRYIVKQLPPFLTQPPLKPNGDLCSCKATVVSPALVPKPAAAALRFDTSSKLLQRLQAAVGSYSTQQQQQQQQVSAVASSSAFAPQAASYIPPPQPVVPSYQPPYQASYQPSYSPYYPTLTAPVDPVPVPSDPVSLQLALKAQREATKTLEDKLSFGFRSLPIDATIKKINGFQMAVPEEKLLAMNGAVVALQPPREVLVQKDVDEEAGDYLEGKQEVEVVAAGKKPTLGEVGFAPAYIVPAPTYTVPEAPAPAPAAYPAGPSAVPVPVSYGVPGAPSLPCNEIYPGQVQTGNTPNREKYILPAPPLPPCNDDVPSYSYSSSASSSSSQSASSSASLSLKQNSDCGCCH